jgi:hypothetical protein
MLAVGGSLRTGDGGRRRDMVLFRTEVAIVRRGRYGYERVFDPDDPVTGRLTEEQRWTSRT